MTISPADPVDAFWFHIGNGHLAEVSAVLKANPQAIKWLYTQNGLNQPVTMLAHDLDMLRLLLEHRADADAADRVGDTRLIQCGDGAGAAALMIEYGADVDKPNNNGTTPLMRAAFNNAVGVVKVLLENGANPDIESRDGKTAEMIARERSFPEMANLIASYADKKHVNELDQELDQELDHFRKGLDHEAGRLRPLVFKKKQQGPAALFVRA